MSKIVKGSAGLSRSTDPYAKERARAKELALKFETQMNHFQSLNLEESRETMLYWHECFYDILKHDKVEEPPEGKWLRPSMIGSDEMSLWYNLNNHLSDEDILDGKPRQKPYHTRWQAIGTVVGDMWQKQVLSAEHWGNRGVHDFDFRFLKLIRDYGQGKKNYPAFEEFTRTTKYFGDIPVHGTCDGILEYVPYHEDLERCYQGTHIGFEVKSKQTSYASTGHYSMKVEDPKHVRQAKTYALMYGLDYYFFIYQNCAKKSWNQTEEDQSKYPDLRVFGIYISPEEKEAHIEYLKKLWHLQFTDELPRLDLLKWNFSSHKKAILKDMTREEFGELTSQLLSIENGRSSAFEKKSARTAYDEIEAYMIEHKGLYKDILGGN
ncbi:hypothetical protein [Bacillus wiedmannii]|uniref:hypothetical protein n=1 Tax=Bacillus wiedmannii TaxID=1890302 RepID=UPI000CD80C56|nr:hypothetical protein [Bacillus wiedmannii]MBG9829695.1 hypothetical protein [Bacillus wiedmannii]UOB95765.1 hypothetical protein BTI679_31080 [Bacillus wiedmannii]